MKKKLRIFDFDNTLIVSDSKIKITKPNGQILYLNSANYLKYSIKETDKLDFSEFDEIINPTRVIEVSDILASILQAEVQQPEGRKVVILTARRSRAKEKIRNFLLDCFGSISSKIEIITLDSSKPEDKKEWIKEQLITHEYNDIQFFDDSKKNIVKVEELKKEFPHINIVARDVSKYSSSYL